jgi:hypothetical protein
MDDLFCFIVEVYGGPRPHGYSMCAHRIAVYFAENATTCKESKSSRNNASGRTQQNLCLLHATSSAAAEPPETSETDPIIGGVISCQMPPGGVLPSRRS